MTRMNNLLKVALSEEDYTHLRVTLAGGEVCNFIYAGVVMNDLEVHYTLAVLLEEFEFPELERSIQVFRQRNQWLTEDEIKIYLPDE